MNGAIAPGNGDVALAWGGRGIVHNAKPLGCIDGDAGILYGNTPKQCRFPLETNAGDGLIAGGTRGYDRCNGSTNIFGAGVDAAAGAFGRPHSDDLASLGSRGVK